MHDPPRMFGIQDAVSEWPPSTEGWCSCCLWLFALSPFTFTSLLSTDEATRIFSPNSKCHPHRVENIHGCSLEKIGDTLWYVESKYIVLFPLGQKGRDFSEAACLLRPLCSPYLTLFESNLTFLN